MATEVFAQAECNYRHLQDAIAMLPAATRELDPNARPDTLRALSAMTAAVTGANPQLFFAVAEVDGVTAGFLGGALANFLLESRTLVLDILLYVVPEHRNAGVASAALTAASTKLGFVPAGTVMTLKVRTQEQWHGLSGGHLQLAGAGPRGRPRQVAGRAEGLAGCVGDRPGRVCRGADVPGRQGA